MMRFAELRFSVIARDDLVLADLQQRIGDAILCDDAGNALMQPHTSDGNRQHGVAILTIEPRCFVLYFVRLG